MDPTLFIVLLGTLTVTSYQPVAGQTDASPTWTSIGDRTTRFGIAVSQDLLKSKKVKYGDMIKIEGMKQMRVVNDCMNIRHTNRVDLLVFTHAEEQKVGVKRRRVWVVRPKE